MSYMDEMYELMMEDIVFYCHNLIYNAVNMNHVCRDMAWT